ncbi:hypothetical protein GCM10025867_25670 [Frondihabitans sucicola]|uniref:Uncharacterized protein n=1 Tax=Frondihabitans sucicola TaxID=1268041 RepID=A0ABN6Y2Y1_9MICO|nr:hypothetical protein [Frondihabitans sucicola]BDZ50326.1 hypothetical protein GCM10025867_25670 [Frondihabitans sucicola]
MAAGEEPIENPSSSPSIERAIAASVAWPEAEAALAPEWGWRDVFASVSDHLVERLRSGAGYVAILADESKRDRWPAELDGLSQDVYADVYSELLERRTLATLIRLWQFYASVLGKPNRPGIDDLDPDAPIGPIGADLPEVAEYLMDDVGDVLTAVITKQIVDRFGVAPE